VSKEDKNLFQRLTRLFKSGPVVKRKVKRVDTAIAVADKVKSSGTLLFQRSTSPTYSVITANSYNLSERLMRYQDFQEMEYCLHGDTLIAVPGGYRTIKELSEDCSKNPDHRFIVYSYDHNLGRIVPAVAKQARQTTIDQSYVVIFDNGQKIIGSSNHRLMKRDGTYCMIENLKPGDAMMPFYRRDLFNRCKEDGDGYRWIYSMDRRSKMNGWVAEHRILGEMIKGSQLEENEVVHHINFKKNDNRLENLRVMTGLDHRNLHTKIINGAKWSEKNAAWIEQFKVNHSKFIIENNPSERKDITFGRILEISEKVDFNLYRVCEVFGTDPNVIKRRLRKHGYQNFEVFSKAYNPDWRNHSWDNKGEKNPRYEHCVTFDLICSKFSKGMSKVKLAQEVSTTTTILDKRIKSAGYKNFTDFSSSYENMKVVSIELGETIPLYDLTVDGYKNFATDSVISHNTAEIAAAMDIYADETVAQDDKGRVLHIYSDDEKVRDILEDLFYNVLNVEFNLRSWARNLVKYGDFFLYNDVSPTQGVVHAFPIPVNEIEREENYDREDPFAVRYRWSTLGNRTLENWEVTHFRLLGNDMFLPYGSSLIEPARRIWRQLILLEDAMLVYRIVRAPERRVFYIDVANIPPENVPMYVEEQRKNLRTNQVIDRNTGRVDLRYSPLSVEDDYFIAVRGGESGTKIDTLSGGQNAATVEDVQYMQKKLFAALKVPRAYLGYDEMLSSKATLAQEDIRFSRTISVIQKTILSELNKLAIIHLYSHGYDGEDLQNFTLRLSNPSTIAQQQKLELWKSKFEIGGSLPEGMGSRRFVQKEIWGLNDDQIDEMNDQRLREKITDLGIEGAKAEGGEEAGGGEELPDLGGEEEKPAGGGEKGGEEAGGDIFAGDDAADDVSPNAKLLMSSNIDDDVLPNVSEKDGLPVKPGSYIQRYKKNRSRRRVQKHMPDFSKMLDSSNSSLSDPHDKSWMKSLVSDPFGESVKSYDNLKTSPPSLSPNMVSTLKKMSNSLGIVRSNEGLLTESEEIDLDIKE
jgi:hypothetical protein